MKSVREESSSLKSLLNLKYLLHSTHRATWLQWLGYKTNLFHPEKYVRILKLFKLDCTM